MMQWEWRGLTFSDAERAGEGGPASLAAVRGAPHAAERLPPRQRRPRQSSGRCGLGGAPAGIPHTVPSVLRLQLGQGSVVCSTLLTDCLIDDYFLRTGSYFLLCGIVALAEVVQLL